MWGDGNDEELLRALEESRRFYEEVEVPRLSQIERAQSPVTISDEDSLPGPSTRIQSSSHDPFLKPQPPVYRDEDSLPGPSTSIQSSNHDAFQKPQPAVHQDHDESEDGGEFYDGPEADGFSLKNGKIWVYPTSDAFPVRAYQRSIVETAIFHNTLVSLPTGLGKTFIAAVVMYNFYMWYPKGKIIFMAPTKPLVAQQIENCINFMGIPESHTAEMTGAMHKKIRAGYWREKRVFFLTPQCVQNDLTANICPANAVKCVVIDEAHRALGDHAFAQVIRILNSYEARFRVLALSATPGSDLEAVQKVVSNLMISHIESREEDSPDLAQYTHERNLEKMVVDVGPTISRIRVKLVGIAADYAQRLQQRKLLFGTINSIPRFTVLREWECFRLEKSNTMDPLTVNKINVDFATVLCLVHGLELLQTYGLRLLLNHLKSALNKGDQNANRLSVNEELKSLMDEIDGILNPVEIDGAEEGGVKKKIYGHPKLDRLQEVVVSHFENFEKKGEATRAIVFCEYREGVIEICDMLKHYKPLVKPVVFMGQSTGKGGKGISQKRQGEIMEKFKEGSYNTLISTSVGEEGLDIGEVDLIICFDAKNSPIRQVQRMGRTGRKRQGRIIMLLTRGKEEQKFILGLHKKKNIKAVLLNKENLANHLLDESPRMLPPGVEPKYIEKNLEPPVPKPKKSNQQDLRKMFAKRTKAGGSGPSNSGRSSIGKASCLSEDDLEELKALWNTEECLKFNKIPERVEFWAQASDEIDGSDLAATNIDLSTYIEYLRHPQRTHLVGNSSDSKLLSELLLWADERREGDVGGMFGGLSSQVTSTQMLAPKSKKRSRPPATDTNSTHPPKKRGRPKKTSTIDSHFLPQSKDDIDVVEPQPSKPRSKFIEDDDEDAPEKPTSMLESHKPKLIFATIGTATVPLPARKSVPPNLDTPAVPEVDDVLIIDSDDENDSFNSSSSWYADLSSQVSRQDLYRDLSRALRNQTFDEEDDCNICDTLFCCDSYNRLVIERKVEKVDKSWNDISKSLEDAFVLVPQITRELLTSHYCPEIESCWSLMPKFEISAEDEMADGLLCGGVGDLLPPRDTSPSGEKSVISKHSPISVPKKIKEESFCLAETKQLKLGEKRSILAQSFSSLVKKAKEELSTTDTMIKDQGVKKELVVDEISSRNKSVGPNEFEDVSFDFLGINDISPSQKSDEEVKNHTQFDTEDQPFGEQTHFESPEGSLPPQNQVKSESSPNHRHGPCSPVSAQLSTSFLTPPKASLAVAEQVSPILCSQAIKKPRFGRRLRKQSAQCQRSKPNEESGVNSNFLRKETFESVRGSLKNDEQVTSSSQLMPSPKNVQPLAVNFDLFDDSLFPLSDDEDKGNKGVVDESLREAIVQKALEAKAKKNEITLTQEVSKICEAVGGGLTQVMEIYDAKEKREDVIIQRADSSSAQLNEGGSCSPISQSSDELNVAHIGDANESVIEGEGGSEEDLFADCDDSLFHGIDSSEQLPVTPAKNDIKIDAILPAKINLSPVSGEKVLIDKMEAEVSEVIHNSNRSASPIFKPSQVMKRPSKLSLKKINSEKPPPVEEPSPKSQISKCWTSETPRKETSSQKEIMSRNESQQHTVFSQIDFSMYVDEFNSTWTYSQDDKSSTRNSKDKSDIDGPCVVGIKEDKKVSQNLDKIDAEVKSHYAEVPKNVLGHKEACQNVDKIYAKVEIQNPKISRDSSPDSEMEAAFARLDAERNERKKSFGNTSFSTPKISKIKSIPQQDQPIAKPVGSISFRKKLSLKDTPSSSKVNTIKNGWISAEPREQARYEISRNNHESSLTDFVDESLVEDLLNVEDPDFINDENIHREKSTSKLPAQNSHMAVRTSRKNFTECGKLQRNIGSDELGGRKKLSLGKKTMSAGPLQEQCKNKFSSKEAMTNIKTETVIVLSSSDEEGVIQNQRRGKKCLNITSSSEEGLHAPRDNKNSALDLSTFCDDSLLNDLVDAEAERQLPNGEGSSSDEDVFVRRSRDRVHKGKTQSRKNTKKKAAKKRNGFIMSEAEESEDGQRLSSDGEGTTLDELDSSFINDSQPEASQSVVDIHHKYLEAVRSPAGAVGRFKIPKYLPDPDINVYSQYPDASELDQTYANDSFCVDNEPTQYEPEMSLLELAEAKLKARRKEKRKRKKNYDADASGSDDMQDDHVGKRKQLKRIKVFEETIIEDDDQATCLKESSPSVDFIKSNNSKSSLRNSTDTQNNDLAKLLDADDFDFSVIPDTFESILDSVAEPPKSSNAKFVKKTPFMLNNIMKSMKTLSPVKGLGSSTSMQNPVSKTVSSTITSTSVNSRPVSFASIKDTRGPCSTITSTSNKSADSCHLAPTLIIASSKQIAQSPDVLRVLRVNYQIVLVPHFVPDADYILSWRQGASRIFASDLKDRKKLEDVVKKLKQSFSKPCLIIENDRLKLLASLGPQKKGKKSVTVAPASVDPGSSSLSPWSSAGGCANAALLRQAGVQLLFSQNSDDTAGYLAKLARRETNAGHGIPVMAQNVSDEIEARLSFFACLPGINYAFAFKLLSKFGTLAEFFKRCSSVNDIAASLGLDYETSRKIHQLLCEVYFNP